MKATKTASKARKDTWLKTYCRMTKAQLIAIIVTATEPSTMTEIIPTNQENLKTLLQVIQERSLEDNVNWQAFRKMYFDLDRQFTVPKKPWYSLEEYIGWWWRIPFSWYLRGRAWIARKIVRTQDRRKDE